MGQTSSAIIAYGIPFDENSEIFLPWEGEEFDSDEEKWWRSETGYAPPFEVFDSSGRRRKDVTEDQISEYFKHQRQWMSDHPMPFCVKFFGFELAGSIITSPKYPYCEVDWGAADFNPLNLWIASDEDFELFLQKYLPDAGSPRWLLAAKYF